MTTRGLPIGFRNDISVLFAPDYRLGLPYQALLADALKGHGIEVSFLTDYYRGLPLYRGTLAARPGIVHLHWPERYFQTKGDRWDRWRVVRYPLDLWLTMRHNAVVVTAHNLLPHNRWDEPGVYQNIRKTVRTASAVFVHSEVAREQMCATFGVSKDRCYVIPIGDHSVTLGTPTPRETARAELGLPAAEKVCLVFGTVSPYKGTDEIVRFWVQRRITHRLVIAGPVISHDFAECLRRLALGSSSVDLRLSDEWLDNSSLRCWLSAADCTIFNYKQVLTSGGAALSRSYGVPTLIPSRLTAADLGEPHPHVLRFDDLNGNFDKQMERALRQPSDYDLARDWREKTSWANIARITAAAYQQVLQTAD
jgi:hypothetical protein